MKTTARLLMVVLLVMGSPRELLAQAKPGDLSQVTLEDLLNIEVTSASRKEQRADQVPAAVHVITQDDIRCPVRLAAIKAAVEDLDPERIRTAAHALKGAAGNVSATGLFDAARTLERIGTEGRLEAAEAGRRRVATEASLLMDALRQFEMTVPGEGSTCAH